MNSTVFGIQFIEKIIGREGGLMKKDLSEMIGN